MELLGGEALGPARTLRGRPDPPKCDPETRIAVNKHLLALIQVATMLAFIWLHGGAGAAWTRSPLQLASVPASQASYGADGVCRHCRPDLPGRVRI